MLGNGVRSAIGAFFGNPFPVTVYVGHVGWKALGARLGYSLAAGTSMLLFGLFSLGALLLAIIPLAAVGPILIFIGIVTANQVVRETPRVEVPVIFVALFPWIANWALTLVGNVLKAAGTRPAALGAMALAYLMVAVVFVVNYATDGANRWPVDMPETESATPVAAPTAPVKRAAVTTTGATSAAETAGRTATAVIDEGPPQRS